MFFKMGVLKKFANFTGEHPCCSLFLINLQAKAYNFIKNETPALVFHVKFAKFLRTPIFTEHQ